MNFTFGAMNGSMIGASSNLTNCQKTINVKWVQNGIKLKNDSLSGKYFVSIDDFLFITYNTNIVAHSCYYGFQEAGINYWEMLQIYLIPKYLSMNIIYNFGDIYTNFRDFLLLGNGNTRGNNDVSAEAGFSLGQSIYYVIQPYE